MMRVAHVKDRLSALLIPGTFVEVTGLGGMPENPLYVKWQNRAYVIPKADMNVGFNTSGTGDVSQRVTRVISVMIGFVRMTARKIGDLDSAEDVIEAVKASLVGWTPSGESAPVIYIGGGIGYQDIINGLLIWGVDFGCPYYIEG